MTDVGVAGSATVGALVAVERERLSELEGIVERGLKTFVQVGDALMEIRDLKLYRESHGTFEDYCSERWQMTDRHARRMIAAAGVVAEIGPIDPVPASEAQARELAPLLDHPDQLRQAWTETVEET